MIYRPVHSPIEYKGPMIVNAFTPAERRNVTRGDATAQALFELAQDVTVNVLDGFEIEFFYVYVNSTVSNGCRPMGHASENSFIKVFDSDAGANAGVLRLVLNGNYLDFEGLFAGVAQNQLVKIRIYVDPADATTITAELNDIITVSRPTGPATVGSFNQLYAGGGIEYVPGELLNVKFWTGGDRATGSLISVPINETGFNNYLNVLHNVADSPVVIALSGGTEFNDAIDGSVTYDNGVIDIVKNVEGGGMVGWTFDADLLDADDYIISFDIVALAGSGAALQQWDDNWTNTQSTALYAYSGPVELLLTNAGKIRFVIQGWATGHVQISNIVVRHVGPGYAKATNFVLSDTRPVDIDDYQISEVNE